MANNDETVPLPQSPKRELLDKIHLIEIEQKAFWESIRLSAALAVEEVTSARIRFLKDDKKSQGSTLFLDVVLELAMSLIPIGRLASGFLKVGFIRSSLLRHALKGDPRVGFKEIFKSNLMPSRIILSRGQGAKEAQKDLFLELFRNSVKFSKDYLPIVESQFKLLVRVGTKKAIMSVATGNSQAYFGQKRAEDNQEDAPSVQILDAFTTFANTRILSDEMSWGRLKEYIRDPKTILENEKSLIDAHIEDQRTKFKDVADDLATSRKVMQRFIEACIWSITYDFKKINVVARHTPPNRMHTTTSNTTQPMQKDVIEEKTLELDPEFWQYLSRRLIASEFVTAGSRVMSPSEAKRVRDEALRSLSKTGMTFAEYLKGSKLAKIKREIISHLDALRENLATRQDTFIEDIKPIIYPQSNWNDKFTKGF